MSYPDLSRAIIETLRPEMEELAWAAVTKWLDTHNSPWMTTEEAAEYLRTTPAAVRQRAQRGTIPAHKDDGGRWLFHREELDLALGYPGGRVP